MPTVEEMQATIDRQAARIADHEHTKKMLKAALLTANEMWKAR